MDSIQDNESELAAATVLTFMFQQENKEIRESERGQKIIAECMDILKERQDLVQACLSTKVEKDKNEKPAKRCIIVTESGTVDFGDLNKTLEEDPIKYLN